MDDRKPKVWESPFIWAVTHPKPKVMKYWSGDYRLTDDGWVGETRVWTEKSKA